MVEVSVDKLGGKELVYMEVLEVDLEALPKHGIYRDEVFNNDRYHWYDERDGKVYKEGLNVDLRIKTGDPDLGIHDADKI